MSILERRSFWLAGDRRICCFFFFFFFLTRTELVRRILVYYSYAGTYSSVVADRQWLGGLIIQLLRTSNAGHCYMAVAVTMSVASMFVNTCKLEGLCGH